MVFAAIVQFYFVGIGLMVIGSYLNIDSVAFFVIFWANIATLLFPEFHLDFLAFLSVALYFVFYFSGMQKDNKALEK